MELLVIAILLTATGVQGQVQFPENTVATVGYTASLRCAYQAKSCSQIRWQKRSESGQVANISDGNTVYNGSKYRLDVWSFCDLVIKNVQLQDSGTFICTIAGSVSGSAELIVLEARPSCNTSCVSNSTAENDVVKVECSLTYEGSGRAEMTWLNGLTYVEIHTVPPGWQFGGSVSRDFSGKAIAPMLAPLVCVTKFYFDRKPGRASNVQEVWCHTKSCSIVSADADGKNAKDKNVEDKNVEDKYVKDEYVKYKNVVRNVKKGDAISSRALTGLGVTGGVVLLSIIVGLFLYFCRDKSRDLD